MKQALKNEFYRVLNLVFSKHLLVTICALTCISFSALAQELIVTGNVTDTDGYPIPGASVVIKESTNGTITDMEGKYSIKVNRGAVLVFRFVGMKDQEKKVEGPVLNVKLKSEIIGLDEVVAIGYGTVKKKELTGAVAQVKSEDITRVVTSDVGTALQGLVAGVNVTANSGAPGESSSILIRGVSSITAGNEPLYVVDGVPQSGDPRLSPNEIETIDILKDAASCAIYGTRGAAGVILITTKQGKEGALKVSANGSYGVQSIRSGTPLMNAREQTYGDFLYNRNLSGTTDNKMNLPMLRSAYNFQNDSDLSELVLVDNAAVQDYNVNLSGGGNGISYNVVAGYYKKDGTIRNSQFERFNTRVNTLYKNGSWRINANVGLSHENTDRSAGGLITQTIKYHPTMPLFDPDSDDPIETNDVHESNRVGWVIDSFKNRNETKRNTSFANFNVNYEILKGLNISSRIATRVSDDYQHQFNPFQIVYDVDGELVGNPEMDSYVKMSSSRSSSLTWDVGLTYKLKLNQHNLTFFAGQSAEKYTYNWYTAGKTGVTDNDIEVLDGAVSNPSASSGNRDSVRKILGTIGRVQYAYKSKYLLSASVRRDGSSNFGPNNQWGTFPSASAAWNVADEAFWSGVKNVVNNFKVRASYGQVGNQNFTPYSYAASITQGLDYSFSDDQLLYGAAMTSYANADVKWETSIQTNVGIDMAFLSNKITMSAEYYNTTKKDMLFNYPVAGSNGSIPNYYVSYDRSSSVVLNRGNMTNQGFEFAMSYKANIGRVKCNFSGTFSTNDNEVTYINGKGGYTLMDDWGLISGRKAHSQITALAEGYEAGAFFLYRTNGVIDTHAKLAEYQKLDAGARMGDVMYVDANNDGKIFTNEDRVYSGSGIPEYEVGFNMNAEYKGFDFSMQWYSAIGHEIMNGAKATAFGWGRHQDLLYQWSEANPTSHIPAYRGETNKHRNYEGHTDLWMEDGTYLRLKQITLGYSLPKRIINKWSVSKFRVYLSAQNPLTFTKYEGYDPEVGGSISSKGLDKGNYPVTSLYSVGVNLNF